MTDSIIVYAGGKTYNLSQSPFALVYYGRWELHKEKFLIGHTPPIGYQGDAHGFSVHINGRTLCSTKPEV